MGSNIEILDNWVKGNKLRPTTIHFHTEKEMEQQKKNATKVGDIYIDPEGKQYKRVGPTTWSRTGTILDAMKESNPDCVSCGCEIDYKHRYNVTSYQRSRMCFDCMIETDTQRKVDGTYELYEQRFVFERQRDYVIDMLVQLKEGIANVEDNLEFINEFGDREKWHGLDTKRLKEEMLKDVEEGEKALLDIAESLERVEKEIDEREDG